MNKHRSKWLGLVVVSLATLFLVGGCGGSSSSKNNTVAKAAISGSVTFPSLGNLVAKQVPKSVSVAPVYGVPTVELRNLSGVVVATATVTGTAPGPYSYTFSNIDMGADYVVKAYVPNTNYVVKALIDKNALITATTRNIDTVSTTVVIVTEQKLGATPGTMGDTANAAKFTTDAIAAVNPVALEGAINTAIGTVTGTSAVNATSNDITLMNLVNVVTSTVFSGVNTSSFIAGTVATPISTTQYSFVAAGVAPTPATVAVQSTTVYTTIVAPTQTAYTPPDPNTVTFTSRVMDYSGAAPVALSGVEVTANGLKTYTDASGFYTLAGIIKNTSFYVKMSQAGYADSYSARQNITANSNSSTRPYALWPPAKLAVWGNFSGAGVISARVVDSTNLETGYIGGVVVTATDAADPAVTYPVIYSNATTGALDPALTSTAANGSWMFRNVPAGKTVNVTATKSGYTFNTRTFFVVADSVCQGRITGTAVATPPVTTSQIKTIMTSGLFEFSSNWDGTKNYYFTKRISLAANGVNLAETFTSYLDPVSKTWSTTAPSGFPTNTNSDYTLTATGWVQGIDNPSNYVITFNADGSANLSNSSSGASALITISPVDVTGQAISLQGLSGAILVAAPTVFPAGSLRYDMVWNQLSNGYSLWDSYGNSLGTDLTLIPGMFLVGTGMQAYIDSSSVNSYFAQFVGGASTVVNIYQQGTTTPILIGTATYSITTVNSKQILEISIPSALRTQYSLGDNPIFALAPTNFIALGGHSTIGISNSNGKGGFNEIAINHIKANINTALAKPALARKISKAILGM
jgi:hypothetical protein